MIIRAARWDDAAAMTRVRAASIRALCSPDHHDDPQTIDGWIGDPTKFAKLLAMPEATLIVAEIDGHIAGVGGVCGNRITLNYVDPAHRNRGIGTALMAELERRLAQSGVTLGQLDSTVTALEFYKSLGWVEAGVSTPETGQPMVKPL